MVNSVLKKIKKIKVGKLNTALYLCIFVLSLVFLIILANAIVDKKDEVISTKSKVAQLDYDIELLDKISKDRNENAEKLNTMNAFLPASYEEVAYFTRNLEEIAKAEGESLEVAIDKTAKNEGSVSSLKFIVTTEGDYQSIKNTLSLLADLPYHTSVDSLKVDSDKAGVVTLTNFRLFIKKQ